MSDYDKIYEDEINRLKKSIKSVTIYLILRLYKKHISSSKITFENLENDIGLFWTPGALYELEERGNLAGVEISKDVDKQVVGEKEAEPKKIISFLETASFKELNTFYKMKKKDFISDISEDSEIGEDTVYSLGLRTYTPTPSGSNNSNISGGNRKNTKRKRTKRKTKTLRGKKNSKGNIKNNSKQISKK